MTAHQYKPLPVYPDPLTHLLLERGPKQKGVGRWVPEQKHKLLSDYLYASQHAWRKWPNRVLIDPFCGPGRIQVEGESFTRDGGALVAWRQLATLDTPFTKCLVGDINTDRAQACAQRLTAAGAHDVSSFVGPATETVPQMLRAVPKDALCFAFIDPYNLALLSFDMLRKLAELKIDLAIHFSTQDLLRNVDLELDPVRARFDDVLPGWREDPRYQSSKGQLPDTFFLDWVQRVKGLNFKHAKQMPLVTNNTGHGLYRMVFFARHDLPIKLWNDVARDATRSLFSD